MQASRRIFMQGLFCFRGDATDALIGERKKSERRKVRKTGSQVLCWGYTLRPLYSLRPLREISLS